MEKVKNKFGISLIVLVITILVMVILAGVVVVTMQENNPIEKAKIASFQSNVATYVEELSVTIADRLANGVTEKINAREAEISKYIPSCAKKDAKKFAIVDNKLAYVGSNLQEEALAGEAGVLAKGKGKAVFVDRDFGPNGQDIDASTDYNNVITLREDNNPIITYDSVSVEITAMPTRETFLDESQLGNVNNWRPGQNTLIAPHTGKTKEKEVFIGINLGTNGLNLIEHANDWYPFTAIVHRDLSAKHTYKYIINKKEVSVYIDGVFIKKYTPASKRVGINLTKLGGGIYGGFKGKVYNICITK